VPTILIVDNQANNLGMLERLLRSWGYEVMQAQDSVTALQIAEQRQPDLVLLDILTPEMDGLGVIRSLRRSPVTSSLPVMVLTANAPDEQHKIRGLNLGADEYLTKPINDNELRARIRALLRTRQAQDELVARNAQLSALVDIMQASISTLDLVEVGQRLLERAIATAGMDLGGIWLREDEELVCLAQQGYSQQVAEERRRIPLAESRVSVQAMESGTVIFGTTSELYGTKSGLTQDAQTLVVLPLTHRGRALGVLHLGTREARTIDKEELAFLGAIANVAAAAVQNARLFEEADRQRRQLERLDREREEFISIISHELKNPLASIKGYAGLLLRRASKDTTLQSGIKGLDVIEQQANRMSLLLDQLRDVSQIGMDRFTIEPAPLDLAGLARRIALDMQATTTDHQIYLDVRDEPLMTAADEFRMTQVLENLISNAIKYSPAGSLVEIVVQRSNDPPARPLALPAADWVVVTVRDRGIGIPHEVQQRLFERFYRASNAKGKTTGMGLGLYITREIVVRHSGYIWLESEEGQGSLFGVALPLLPKVGLPSVTPDTSPAASEAMP
jgi:two-component system cell cycle sensor histidine kinase PleC